MYSIPQLQHFAEKNDLLVSYQPCLYPKFLSIQSLPTKEKLQILKFYDSVRQAGHLQKYSAIKTNVLKYMMNEQIDSYVIGETLYKCNAEFKNFNTLLDKTRKESFKEVFPMLSEWYDSI